MKFGLTLINGLDTDQVTLALTEDKGTLWVLQPLLIGRDGYTMMWFQKHELVVAHTDE